MVDSIGRDSIGRASFGKSGMMGRDKRSFLQILQETIQKSEEWRNRARRNLIRVRERYKLKVKTNEALMRARKADRARVPNLNPSAVTIGDKTKTRQYGATYSTVPLKPRYSRVKPAKRIYGNNWKKLERRGKT
jgi:hypothetical protein